MKPKFATLSTLLLVVLILGGCATNPVTGENELSLVSESAEIDIGNKQYLPSQQMQGGNYSLDPALTAYVREVGRRLVKVSDRPLPYEFVVVNDSTPNAWALPGGKIAVNRGLLVELKSEAELAAVLAHEIVHAAARHGAKGIERGMLLQGAVIAAGAAAGESDYSKLAVGAAAIGANIINQRYSRDAELEADRFGMLYMARAGYDPMAAVALQETFLRLSKNRQSNWLTGLFASHPPSAERVEKNRETARKLGKKGGELGVQRYRQQIAGLKRRAPAYKAYEQGRKALGKKNSKRALQQAKRAQSLEPAEALFHALEGDAYHQQKRYPKALAAYDRAVARESGFFRHYLKRGEVRAAMGDRSGARQDLQRSLKLLPTADAHYLLGLQYSDSGNRSQALAHFKQASASSSESGRAAKRELVLLDLPANPNRYLRARLGRDKAGRVIIQLENPTPVTLTNFRIQLGKRGAAGQLLDARHYSISRNLSPGEMVSLRTGVRVPDDRTLKQWRARVTGADITQ